MASEFESQESYASSYGGQMEDSDDDVDVYDGFDEDVIDDDKYLQNDPERYDYACVSEGDIWLVLHKEVTQLSKRLQIDEGIARLLLYHCKWSQEDICKRYNEDRVKLYIDAHIYPSVPDGSIGMYIECPICFNDDTSSLMGLECGHIFCHSCWINHIAAKLERGLSITIECMQCDVRIPMEMVQELFKNSSKEYKCYHQRALTQLVESHPLIRWCPGKDCQMIFHVKEVLPKGIECANCKTRTCFQCGEEYHSPTDCESFKSWLIKCQDDSETANYIASNTKDCPKCSTAIEKNGGCNHMHCTKCNQDFCWMCMQDWAKHNSEYYQCSRYEANPDAVKVKVTSAREALKKYLFYYERWENHHRSLLLEEQTREKIATHIKEHVTAGHGTWIDWQYLLDAADLLKKVCHGNYI
jgi:ariadne-2